MLRVSKHNTHPGLANDTSETSLWDGQVVLSSRDTKSSSEVLESLVAYLGQEGLSLSNAKVGALLWCLEEAIPYLETLLAFELSVLPGENVKDPHVSKGQHARRITRRYESKLQEIRSSMITASSQLEFVFSLLEDSVHSTLLKERYSKLRERQDIVYSIFEESSRVLQRYKKELLTKLQIDLTNVQIAESRQAMDQASTVAKLTILAFIFIPISAVTGVFGMNVKEITDGTRLWMFGVTAGPVVAGSVALAFYGTVLSFVRRLIWRLADNAEFNRLASRLFSLMKPLLLLWRTLGTSKLWLSKVKRQGENLRRGDREAGYDDITKPTAHLTTR